MVLALLIDRFIGELPNRFHPLRWMGNVLGWIDRRLRKRKGLWAVSLGFLSYMLILSIFGWVALLLTACLRTYVPEPYGEYFG
jgi:adenosylcobinamide-phosphate synthase